MKRTIVCLLMLAQIWPHAASSGVPCEKIEESRFGWAAINSATSCLMNISTVIGTEGFTITTPVTMSVEGFSTFGNRKIKFLPETLAEKFPNLIIMWAQSCSIEKISKNNFKSLNKLRGLAIGDNRIEKIASNTFGDLLSLTHLYMGGNKIKYLNGGAFAALTNLKHVTLINNVCIKDNFLNASQIAAVPQTVTAKCGFTEENATTIETNSEQSVDCEKLKVEIKFQAAEITKLDVELLLMKAENSMHKLNLESKSAEIMRIEKQANVMKGVYDKLDAQLRETFEAKLENKLQEIFTLSNDVQAKMSEINAKNEKIRQLEKKIETLGGNGQW